MRCSTAVLLVFLTLLLCGACLLCCPTERQSQRVLGPGGLINRLVYDSLEPSACSATAAADAADCFSSACSSSASSSCRTTGSGSTTRSNSTVREEAAGAAGACGGSSSEAAAAAGTAAGALGVGAAAAVPAAWYVLQGPDDPTLVFESRFECGNLRRAVQVGW
jgi:hypothetical protein